MPLCMRSFLGPILTSSVLCFVLSYASAFNVGFFSIGARPKNLIEIFRPIFGEICGKLMRYVCIYIYITRIASPYFNLLVHTFSNLPWFWGLTRITGFAERRG